MLSDHGAGLVIQPAGERDHLLDPPLGSAVAGQLERYKESRDCGIRVAGANEQRHCFIDLSLIKLNGLMRTVLAAQRPVSPTCGHLRTPMSAR